MLSDNYCHSNYRYLLISGYKGRHWQAVLSNAGAAAMRSLLLTLIVSLSTVPPAELFFFRKDLTLLSLVISANVCLSFCQCGLACPDTVCPSL